MCNIVVLDRLATSSTLLHIYHVSRAHRRLIERYLTNVRYLQVVGGQSKRYDYKDHSIFFHLIIKHSRSLRILDLQASFFCIPSNLPHWKERYNLSAKAETERRAMNESFEVYTRIARRLIIAIIKANVLTFESLKYELYTEFSYQVVVNGDVTAVLSTCPSLTRLCFNFLVGEATYKELMTVMLPLQKHIITTMTSCGKLKELLLPLPLLQWYPDQTITKQMNHTLYTMPSLLSLKLYSGGASPTVINGISNITSLQLLSISLPSICSAVYNAMSILLTKLTRLEKLDLSAFTDNYDDNGQRIEDIYDAGVPFDLLKALPWIASSSLQSLHLNGSTLLPVISAPSLRSISGRGWSLSQIQEIYTRNMTSLTELQTWSLFMLSTKHGIDLDDDTQMRNMVKNVQQINSNNGAASFPSASSSSSLSLSSSLGDGVIPPTSSAPAIHAIGLSRLVKISTKLPKELSFQFGACLSTSLQHCSLTSDQLQLNDIYTIINNNYSTLLELSLQQSAPHHKDGKAEYDSSVDDDKESLSTPMDKRLTFARLERLTLTLASNRLLTMMRCPLLKRVTTSAALSPFFRLRWNLTIYTPLYTGEIRDQRN
jgi:hypothetical protein